MAEKLAQIFGTEQDKVNCPFYFKMGACRHGDRCSRQHNRPTFSQSVMIPHMYNNPLAAFANMPEGSIQIDRKAIQQQFEDFYEDVFTEVAKFGPVEELQVCDNLCEHLLGNVYIKFGDEESATKCLQGLTGRFYNQRPLVPELTPVTDFHDARCRQYEMGECNRGGVCNFLHLLEISNRLRRRLFGSRRSPSPYDRRRDDRRDDRRDGRDRDRDRDRDYRRDRHHSRDRDDRRDDRRDRDRGDRDRDRDRDYRRRSRSPPRDDRRDRERDRERDRDRDGSRRRSPDRDRDQERHSSRGHSERRERSAEREVAPVPGMAPPAPAPMPGMAMAPAAPAPAPVAPPPEEWRGSRDRSPSPHGDEDPRKRSRSGSRERKD